METKLICKFYEEKKLIDHAKVLEDYEITLRTGRIFMKHKIKA